MRLLIFLECERNKSTRKVCILKPNLEKLIIRNLFRKNKIKKSPIIQKSLEN